MPWPKGRPRDCSHLKEYQFKPGEKKKFHSIESYRKGFRNGAGSKLYDGLSFEQKGLAVRMANAERRRIERELKNNQLFKEKYGALFEDNRTSPWEEEQQENSIQQED